MVKSTRSKIIIVIVVGLLVLCYKIFLPCPFLSSPADKINAPPYINFIWPPTNSKAALGCYKIISLLNWPVNLPEGRGVGVTISVADVLHLETSYEYEHKKPFEDRVSLYVDGQLIPNDSTRLVNQYGSMLDKNFVASVLASHYEISWFPSLSIGKHVAKIVIEAPFGKTLEYEWQFTITF